MREGPPATRIHRLGRQVRRLLAPAGDLLFPSQCVSCDGDASPRRRWCGACEARLSQLQLAPSCSVCAMPLAEHLAPCPYCRGKGLRPFERIACLGTFEPPLRELVHNVKYRNDWPLAELLAERLWQQDAVKEILADGDVIVPVPLHWRRHAARGFNQADVIARLLARRSRKPLRRAAIRLRPTPTQTHLHKRNRRLENLANAFGVADPKSIQHQRVVVVDDVITTAATLQTLAREFRRHDCAAVSAIVVAIADPRGRAFETI